METFETTDLFHAAYCYDEGLQIEGLRRSGSKHKVIMKGPNAYAIAMAYFKGSKAKKLFDAYKTLKDFAYRPKDDDLFYENEKNKIKGEHDENARKEN